MRIVEVMVPVVLVWVWVGWMGGTGCQSDSVPMVTLSGRVVDIFSVQPVEGAELCRLETPNRGCSVSDDEGRFSLELPATGEHWFTVTHPDYYAFLLAMKTLDEDIPLPGPVSIGSREIMDIVIGQTGVSVEPGQGHLLLWVADATGTQGQAGASLDISPDPGGLLMYMDDQGAYSMDATTTSSAGSSGWGNLPPGDYVLMVTHPDLDCEPYSSFSAGAINSFQLKVIADHATALFVLCR
jgi:hypothetical protein